MTTTPTPSRDDLAAAIATIKQVTRASAESCEGDTWTATDISQPYAPCEVDAAIAKILNAVVSGELVRAPSAPVEVAGLVPPSLFGVCRRCVDNRNHEEAGQSLDDLRWDGEKWSCEECWDPDEAELWATAPSASHVASAAKDAEIARLTGERQTLVAALKDGGDVQRLALARAERAEAALAESGAKLAVAYETAADACADYPRVAPDETEWPHYDDQIAHSQECIRALTPADAQNALDKMLEKAREDAIREAAALCAPKKAKVTRGNRFTPSTKNPQSAAAQAARKQCHDAILARLDQRKECV